MAGPVKAMCHALPQESSDSLELELQDSCHGCWEQNAGLNFCGVLFMHVYTYMDMLRHGCGGQRTRLWSQGLLPTQ